MDRTYKNKTTRCYYSSEAFSAALRAISEEGRPIKTVSREYGIPRKTLRRHKDKTVQNSGVSVQGRLI